MILLLKVHFAHPGSARFLAALRALGGGGAALAIHEARKGQPHRVTRACDLRAVSCSWEALSGKVDP